MHGSRGTTGMAKRLKGFIIPKKLGTTALDRQRSQLYTGESVVFNDVSPGISLQLTDQLCSEQLK